MLSQMTRTSINPSTSTATIPADITKPPTISIHQISSTSTSSTNSSISENQDFDHELIIDSENDEEPFELITPVTTTNRAFDTVKVVPDVPTNNVGLSSWEKHIAHGPFSFYSSCSECIDLLARRDATLSESTPKAAPIVPAAMLDVPLGTTVKFSPSSYEEAQEAYEPGSEDSDPASDSVCGKNSAVAAAFQRPQADQQGPLKSHATRPYKPADKGGCGCWHCNGVDLSEAEKPRAASPKIVDIPRAVAMTTVPTSSEEAQENYMECDNNIAPGCIALPFSMLRPKSSLLAAEIAPPLSTSVHAHKDHADDVGSSEVIAVARAIQLHARTYFAPPSSYEEAQNASVHRSSSAARDSASIFETAAVAKAMHPTAQITVAPPSCYEEAQDAYVHGPSTNESRHEKNEEEMEQDSKTSAVATTMQLERQANVISPSCCEEAQDAYVHYSDSIGQEVVSVQTPEKKAEIDPEDVEKKQRTMIGREDDVVMVDEVVGYGTGVTLAYVKKEGCGCWYCGGLEPASL